MILTTLLIAFIQNVAFTMTSRARNRSNQWYHAICSVFSNGLWFATVSILVVHDMDFSLALPYIVGTVAGSLLGANISMKIERAIGATT